MAILPGAAKDLKQQLEEDPQSGPRPITIAEYQQRSAKTPTAPPQQQPSKPKVRGGKAAILRREIANFHRLIKITSDPETKGRFVAEIAKLRQKQKEERKQRNEKKRGDNEIHHLFNKLFDTIQHAT